LRSNVTEERAAPVGGPLANRLTPPCHPLPISFIPQADKDSSHLANYLVELALVDYGMLRFPGSLLAASAVYVTHRCMGKADLWGYVLERHTGFSVEDLEECAVALTKLQKKAPTASLQAVYKKYTNPKFAEVARIDADETLLEN
jgi:G2/mitotic-specific cyclin-B, other